MRKTAIITGATGDIGGAILAEAVSLGYYVLAFGRDSGKISLIKEKFGDSVSTFSIDLANADELGFILKDISMMFPKIDLVVQAAGTFIWDADFPGDTPDEKRKNAIAFLSEANFDSKVRLDRILHEVYGDKIAPLEALIGSHIADPSKFSDEEIGARKGEWGYALPMRNLRKFGEIKNSDPDEKWTYKVFEPGLIDTGMARKAFNMETIGFDPDWNTVMKPDEFAKEFFLEIERTMEQLKNAA